MFQREYNEEIKNLAAKVHGDTITIFDAASALVQFTEAEYDYVTAMLYLNRALAIHVVQEHQKNRLANEGPQAD